MFKTIPKLLFRAQDVSEGGGRLSEKSRQYSVSVTLGEGTEDTNAITDPTPARSMQLNSELEADSNKTLGEKGTNISLLP